MFGNMKGRILFIVVVIALAAFALFKNGVKKGLDLQGGMYLALEVADPENTMTAEARKDATEQAYQVIHNRIDQFGVEEPLIQIVGDNRIIVELAGITDEQRAKDIIERTAFLEFQHVKPTQEFLDALARIDRAIVASGAVAAKPQASDSAKKPSGPSPMDVLFQNQRDSASARGDSAAARGDSASADSADDALPTPGDRNRPLGNLLMDSGQEGEFLVADEDKETVTRYLALPEVQRALPRNTELLWGKPQSRGAETYHALFVLEGKEFMRGTALQDANAGRDQQFGKTMVYFELNRRGGRVFERETGKHIGDRIAIVLDRQVQSAPNVISQISSRGQIEMGNASMEEARDLALVLRAGALPAPIRIIEQRSVGPSLGQDSIDKGKLAGIVGIVAVITIMLVIYRFSGLLAVAALAIYVLLVLGGLAAFQASLSAPGIAGFILSIGMAVDANILIFERTREELLAGKSVRLAVDDGFRHAMSAIIDTNLATVITGLILYQFGGTGPVRGFAVTLVLGVMASFITAVFISHTFMLMYINARPGMKTLSI